MRSAAAACVTRRQPTASVLPHELPRPGHADPRHLPVERRCFEPGSATGDVILRVRCEAVPADSFVTPPDHARMDMRMRGH